MKLWIGKEREGKHLGMYTLFVCGDEINFCDIKKVINDHSTIRQIYFGAGVCSKFDVELIRKCCIAFVNCIITVELRIDDLKKFSTYLLAKENFHIVLTFDDKNKKLVHLNPLNTQFKLQCLRNGGRMIAMGNLEDFSLVDMSKLKSKIYVGDKILK